MPCRYRERIRPVSPIDSPRVSCSSSPRRTSGVAPSSATPTSNETRVRVEGFSKTSATERPASDVSALAPFPAALELLGAIEQRQQLAAVELLARQEVAGRKMCRRRFIEPPILGPCS